MRQLLPCTSTKNVNFALYDKQFFSLAIFLKQSYQKFCENFAKFTGNLGEIRKNQRFFSPIIIDIQNKIIS